VKTRASLRVQFAALLLPVLLHAQARAPFTGTVRDEAGKPLANAEVTCVFVPDFGAPGVPDHATAKTSAEGRFTMPLLVGCAYMVWAIGPSGEGGVRGVVWPRPDGAAGRSLDLSVDERRKPAKLKITGVLPWMPEGPLSLRLLVAGARPLGTDVVIPGDGIVNLPPLPVPQCNVVLQNGRGEPIQSLPCDLDLSDAVAFAEPTEVAFLAQDGEGKPLAGVQILQPRLLAYPTVDRLGDRYVSKVLPRRVLGVTDVDGKAVGRILGDPNLICGRLPGHADSWSGWAMGSRIHDGNVARDEGPLVFVLRPAPCRTLRVLGLADGERVDVWFQGEARYKNGSGAMPYLLAAAAGPMVADGAQPGSEVFARLRLVSDSAVPRRLQVCCYGQSPQLPDVDVAKFRRLSVSVVDPEGRPVACAQFGVSAAQDGIPLIWLDRFVTDSEGRAELLVDDQYAWWVYATSDKASGVHIIGKSDPAGPVVLKLEPLAMMRLRIVDGDGHSVRGARLRYTSGGGGGRSADAVSMALGVIASTVNGGSLELWRSNAAGEIGIPFLARNGRGGVSFKVVAGERVSGEISEQSAGEVQEIVLK